MMLKKTALKALLAPAIIFLALFSFQEVLAVGIGSGSSLNKLIDFKPGLKQTFSYFIVADAPWAMDYILFVEGPLAQYFTLSESRFEKLFLGTSRSFTATMNLPTEKPLAGLHDTQICVENGESLSGGGGFGFKTRACSIITIRVLYPEKYLEIAGFSVPNLDKGDILNIGITVKSWTEEDIGSVKATVNIYGPTEKGFDKKIATLNTEEKSLASNEQETLHASVNTKEFESGEYKAVATVYYDGNDVNASTTFKVGILAVKVLNYTKEFVRNKINKFNIDIESRWNSLIENVYASIILENETLITPAIKMQPWETATLTTYWDTANRKAQYYDGKIVLYFAGNSTEQGIKIKVLINPEEIRRLVAYIVVTSVIVMLIIFIVIMALRKPVDKEHGKTKNKKAR